jgi:hypothetical protein
MAHQHTFGPRKVIKRLTKNGRLRGYAVVAEEPVAIVTITRHRSAGEARRLAVQATRSPSLASLAAESPVYLTAWYPEGYRVKGKEVEVLAKGRL